jgi:hypothetical protein
MEIAQRRTVSAGDLSDSESEVEAEYRGEKMETLVYEGDLDTEELLYWIRALGTYFDYEYVEEYKKVKDVVKRLKGHATLGWDELQANRCCKGKQKIKSWDRMIAKLKAKFIPKDYQITLFRRM